MADPEEELEPLFDYSRVQPFDVVCLDDDSVDESPVFLSKKRKITYSDVEKKVDNGKLVQLIDCDENNEEDWMPPPPKIIEDKRNLEGNSTIKELRLKKQELALLAQSAQADLQAVEETAKRDLSASLQSSSATVPEPLRSCERAKIIISIQNKDELKQFRVYKDDKLERLFKMYADKVKLDLQKLVFCFDGDKINPTATPEGLGMEDEEIIEVHVKSG